METFAELRQCLWGSETLLAHLERVGVEHVGGQRHEIWDAHLEDERWWVVTNPTNLYSQAGFKSRDVALTFHVGLAMRIFTRQRVPVTAEAQGFFAPMWRRWEQAAEALASAEEAEHFQGVGAHLRESLVSFAHEVQHADLVAEGADPPKASDVVAWGGLLADALAPGSANERVRKYLKTLVKPTWDYQQQLLHDKNATRLDAEIGLEAVAHMVSCFTAALLRGRQETSRCERCDAYALAAGACRQCGWEDPSYQAPTVPIPDEEEVAAALAQPCTPSSDISTTVTVEDLLD